MSTTHFVKVYGTILDSSIWYEKDATRLLWITMLAMADSTGYIEAATPGLAGRARISLEDCEEALRLFQSPDKHSKNQEHEGRRAEKVDRGWQLLNYQDYRDMRTEAQVKRAERQARWRAGKAEKERQRVDGVDAPVDGKKATVGDVDAQRGEGRGERGDPSPTTPPQLYKGDFNIFWKAYPKRTGGNPKGHAYNAYQARRKEGIEPDVILRGLHAYTAHHEREQTIGGSTVKQARYWLSPNYRGWELDWGSNLQEPMSDLGHDPDDFFRAPK